MDSCGLNNLESSRDGKSIDLNNVQLTAECLLEQGKGACKAKKYEEAIDLLSLAVKSKLGEFIDDETHPEMGEYYTWYADAVLCKEESNNDLFDFGNANKNKSHLNGNMDGIDETYSGADSIPEEQLAYELFEMARISFDNRFGVTQDIMDLDIRHNKDSNCKVDLEEKLMKASHEHIMDYSFVFMRLGDIELANRQYDEAAKDYKRASILRNIHPEIGPEYEMQSILSHAQALMCLGKVAESINRFERALNILEDIQSGKFPVPPGVTIDDIKSSIEDVRAQIYELRGESTTKILCKTIKESTIKRTSKKFEKSKFPDDSVVTTMRVRRNIEQTSPQEQNAKFARSFDHSGGLKTIDSITTNGHKNNTIIQTKDTNDTA